MRCYSIVLLPVLAVEKFDSLPRGYSYAPCAALGSFCGAPFQPCCGDAVCAKVGLIRECRARGDASLVAAAAAAERELAERCLLYTSPSPRDQRGSRMPSSA